MSLKDSTTPTRDQIPVGLTWDLTHVFPNEEAFLAAFQQVKLLIPALAAFKGKMRRSRSGKALVDALTASDAAAQLLHKVYFYVERHFHQDMTDAKYAGMYGQVKSLSNEFDSAVSYVDPEILTVKPDKLRRWMDTAPGLKIYRRRLEELLRKKAHSLPEAQEELLARIGELADAPDAIFDALQTSDAKALQVVDGTGEHRELTDTNYVKVFMESADRVKRRNGFEALMGNLAGSAHTLATNYAYQVKANILFSRERSYAGSLDRALSKNNIPVSVYDSLVDTMHANIPTLHRYLALRKRVLRLDELHMYDLYVPITPGGDLKMTYDEGCKHVLDAVSVLGSEYTQVLETAMTQRWIDVMPNKGKRGGAYNIGLYGVHPYILLNWHDGLGSAKTLAHEGGHLVHNYLSAKHQPYPTCRYTIFTAEVASTVNEQLLTAHMLKNLRDPAARLAVINRAAEGIRGTMFRQAMFAEFERKAHELAESGKSLTAETLQTIHKELNDKYFGGAVIVDDLIRHEWSRIPHFYNSFYVYMYATGMSAAVALSKQILEEGEPAVQRYLRFLKSGGSEDSMKLLQDAGVDLSTHQPVQQALDVFAGYVTELEQL